MPKPFHLGCDWCMDPNCPGRNGIWTFPAVRWLLDPDYYALPPDFGWAPPDKMPVRREYVEYQKYHPETFYGMKGGGLKSSYPVIGQPTDTSQLGYYYQKVPQWQPIPGRGIIDRWLSTRTVYGRSASR